MSLKIRLRKRTLLIPLLLIPYCLSGGGADRAAHLSHEPSVFAALLGFRSAPAVQQDVNDQRRVTLGFGLGDPQNRHWKRPVPAIIENLGLSFEMPVSLAQAEQPPMPDAGAFQKSVVDQVVDRTAEKVEHGAKGAAASVKEKGVNIWKRIHGAEKSFVHYLRGKAKGLYRGLRESMQAFKRRQTELVRSRKRSPRAAQHGHAK